MSDPCNMLFVLEEEGYVTPTNRLVVERYMKTWQTTALQALLETHVLSEPELANALAATMRIDRLFNVCLMAFAEESLAVLPFRKAREWEVIVVRGEGGRLDLVLADPTRVERINEIKQGLNCELNLSVAERSDIVRAIDELYPLSSQLPSLYGK